MSKISDFDALNQLDIFLDVECSDTVENKETVEAKKEVSINISNAEDTKKQVSSSISGNQYYEAPNAEKKVHPMRRLRKRNVVKMTPSQAKKYEEESERMIAEFLKKNQVTKCKTMWARGSVNANSLPMGD